jgi:hypothetical protein
MSWALTTTHENGIFRGVSGRVFKTAERLIEAVSGDSSAGITPRSDASAFYRPVDRKKIVR